MEEKTALPTWDVASKHLHDDDKCLQNPNKETITDNLPLLKVNGKG